MRTALKSLPKNAAEIPDETLFRLAEERGLNPEMTVSIAHGLGWEQLTVRVGFAADMAARNAQMTKAAANSRERQSIVDVDSIPATSQDYYADTRATQFTSEVLHCSPLSKGTTDLMNYSSEVTGKPTHAIVLDRTQLI